MKLTIILAALLFSTGSSASEKEIGVSELMEKLPSMLDSAPVPPEVTEAAVIELEEEDPETYLFIRGAVSHPPRPTRLGGDGRLSLFRPENGERIVSFYRDRHGNYDQAELAKINHLMRCRLTAKEIPVSVRLVEILDAVEDKFGVTELTLLSGYRTPTLNRHVSGAARRSFHMLGWAADIRLSGQNPKKAAAFARGLRAGGVGYYPDSAFVHLDSGRARYWISGRRVSHTKKRPALKNKPG